MSSSLEFPPSVYSPRQSVWQNVSHLFSFWLPVEGFPTLTATCETPIVESVAGCRAIRISRESAIGEARCELKVTLLLAGLRLHMPGRPEINESRGQREEKDNFLCELALQNACHCVFPFWVVTGNLPASSWFWSLQARNDLLFLFRTQFTHPGFPYLALAID